MKPATSRKYPIGGTKWPHQARRPNKVKTGANYPDGWKYPSLP